MASLLKWSFFVTILPVNEVIIMYDNDELLMLLDDDLFPVEEKETESE